jgi:hypothetical protein
VQLDLLYRGITNVMDARFGVVGNGTTNDLAALEAARNASQTAGTILYFPRLTYGIGNTFYFADGGNAYFEPGATLKLLNSTSTGGAVSGPYPTQTLPIDVHNITVDCNSVAGENGFGFGHTAGMRVFNPKIKNVLHSTTLLGGKAMQFEGTEALNVQVYNPDFENCSIGIDVGAVASAQSVHIGIFNVTMLDVDVPVYLNDTNASQAPDSYDSMEVLIDGLHCRNCGKITWAGGTATGGGIVVADRGYKAAVRNVQVVNDKGGYSSTAYGSIGALVRGTAYGVVLENVLLVADCVALYDFNLAGMQSPGAATTNPYILTDNVRHYGNLDYVVKAAAGTGIGAAHLQAEIGSTLATLAGLCDATAGAITTAYLDVSDRDNLFLATGLKKLSDLYTMGNTLATTVGYPAPSQMEGSWTPIDASGAGLTFAAAEGWWQREGKKMTLWGQVTYPATADASSAKIGGLPVAIKNNLYARAGGVMTVSTIAGATRLYPEANTTTMPILSATSGAVTNATCSGGIFAFTVTYPVA